MTLLAASLHLTASDAQLLGCLLDEWHDSRSSLTHRQLRDRTSLSPAEITETVNDLVYRGLVSQTPDGSLVATLRAQSAREMGLVAQAGA